MLHDTMKNKALLDSAKKILTESQLKEFTLNDKGEPVYPSDGPKFKTGDKIRVTGGPYKGYTGTYTKHDFGALHKVYLEPGYPDMRIREEELEHHKT